ncbi:MAG: hypothetical protein IJ794_19745 [Lachnospiraceae bacterium]|nr:hypothetical protein [Lachnospiraceae bacterium]
MTPTEIYTAILAVCGAIITVSSAVTIIIKAVRAAKAPEDAQNDRLTKLEARMARYDELFANDNKRLNTIEEGNRVTQKAILALLKHGIDGNQVAAMQKAEEELQGFLIDK